jgi:NCAIR mutase (PurE)-related protein
MDKLDIYSILHQVADGKCSVEDAILRLKMQPFEDLGFAKIDSHRALRQGIAEVIYGAGKTPEQINGIITAMLGHGQKNILVTRLAKDAAQIVQLTHPLKLSSRPAEPATCRSPKKPR